MTTHRPGSLHNSTTVERLSLRFANVFESLDATEELFTRDAFFDLNVPVWRFQLEGPDAFAKAQEREEERLFQEDILAMEEEENLYSLPANGYELSAEEQDALEREITQDSVAALETEDEFFQQQILDNEATLLPLFGHVTLFESMARFPRGRGCAFFGWS